MYYKMTFLKWCPFWGGEEEACAASSLGHRVLLIIVVPRVIPVAQSSRQVYKYAILEQHCFCKSLVSQSLMPSLTGNKSNSTEVLNNWTCVLCVLFSGTKLPNTQLLQNPHTWGPALPRDPSYLGTPHTSVSDFCFLAMVSSFNLL